MSSSLGAAIRAARRRKDLTQADLAKATGLGLRSISAYERDEQHPSKRSLEPLERVLETSFTVAEPMSDAYQDQVRAGIPDLSDVSLDRLLADALAEKLRRTQE